MTLLSLAEARDEDESFMSPLDVLFRELETGIEKVDESSLENGEVYNLQGQRVAHPGKGIYMRVSRQLNGTVNTQKVLIR